ncbi:hypothetical protein [Alteromonas sp. C1M14]|uniref:hypothetical protein n=1 Tax=Alteromonas sp. C1M14 TaxID=2841567 RepID=UPI001C09ABEF|nr:hypothetical protein [Alteromonas sp. C1M14]MBU2976612.1 hypothetical protein [Alteromonas sp. C1M14]
MKNFLLAILIATLVVYGLGGALQDWFGMHLMMGDDMLSPLENLAVFSAVSIVFVLIGFVVALSVFGTIAIAVLASVAALVVVGLSALWPVVLVVLAMWIYRQGQRAAHTS